MAPHSDSTSPGETAMPHNTSTLCKGPHWFALRLPIRSWEVTFGRWHPLEGDCAHVLEHSIFIKWASILFVGYLPHIKDCYTLLLPQFPGTFVFHLLEYTKGSGVGGGESSLWTSENKTSGIRDFVTGFETRAMAVIVWGPINNK